MTSPPISERCVSSGAKAFSTNWSPVRSAPTNTEPAAVHGVVSERCRRLPALMGGCDSGHNTTSRGSVVVWSRCKPRLSRSAGQFRFGRLGGLLRLRLYRRKSSSSACGKGRRCVMSTDIDCSVSVGACTGRRWGCVACSKLYPTHGVLRESKDWRGARGARATGEVRALTFCPCVGLNTLHRTHVPRLGQTDDLADHKTRLRQGLYAFECKPLRAFDDRTRKVENSRHRSGQHPILTLIKVPSRPTG
jgi:hypothetical protein